MNKVQALRQARKRFGKTALVEERLPRKGEDQYKGYDGHVRVVGAVMLGLFFEVRGIGPTWESVFQAVDAEKRGTAYVTRPTLQH
ncbi:MAG: hypothetical protein ACYTEQ_30910 [Planctomycetota bacterium]|jgi:Pyruvate/2-oxoacid:ferredoxin oxidoreductase gamma subunit